MTVIQGLHLRHLYLFHSQVELLITLLNLVLPMLVINHCLRIVDASRRRAIFVSLFHQRHRKAFLPGIPDALLVIDVLRLLVHSVKTVAA